MNVKGHKQEGGTCWFHAIINGLLMSPLARKIVLDKLRFISHGERLTNVQGRSIFNNSSCPSVKYSKVSLFWDYIRNRLRGGRVPVTNIRNRNIILSTGLRNNSVRGGRFTDMYALYKKLFPGEYKISFIGPNTPTFVFKTGKKFDRVVLHHGSVYALSHSYITLPGRVSHHIVAGFINKNGNTRVYDSAKNSYHSMNWDLNTDKSVHKVAVYVKIQ